MTTVALDGRGAERGAEAIVAGARAAAADGIARARLRRPGRARRARAASTASSWSRRRARSPTTTSRSARCATRPSASVVLAAADVAEGRSDALVSAGPTGATMTAALFALRRMHGVRRPALAVQLAVPGRDGPAEPAARRRRQHRGARRRPGPVRLPRRRLQPARCSASSARGSRCSRSARSRRRAPQDVVEAHAELAAADGIDFRGNVEGRDLLGDAADVIVTDGFTGNVALKTIEGTARDGRRRGRRRGALEPGRRGRRAAAAPGARRPAPRDGPRHDRRRDPARPARRRGRRPRQLGPGRDRERDPARGARGRARRGRAHRRAARALGRDAGRDA